MIVFAPCVYSSRTVFTSGLTRPARNFDMTPSWTASPCQVAGRQETVMPPACTLKCVLMYEHSPRRSRALVPCAWPEGVGRYELPSMRLSPPGLFDREGTRGL